MWEPSNEIEHRLREALRAEDQDGYFRILAQIELVLPLSYEDSNSGGADTWATWTTDDRTHILAFTSESALQVCLRDNAGASRRVGFAALAAAWPDEEWWLAVNPGLPIEGYLPAWFVSQVSQGMTTVPADPAPTPPADQYPQDRFSAVAHSDPFANPMAPAPASRESSFMPPAPPPPAAAREGSFMPPAPPVPEVPPAPRRSADLSAPTGPTGQHSTVGGTTPAGLPLRQPVNDEPAPDAFNGHSFQDAPQQGQQPPAQSYQPQQSSFPAEPQWPGEEPQDQQWPDAPDWLRDQQPDPLTLPTREPAPPAAAPDPYPAADSFGGGYGAPSGPRANGSGPAPDPFASVSSDFGPPSDAFAPANEPPRDAEAFASMSSAFGRRGAAPEPAPSAPSPAAPRPEELTGEDAEPLLAEAASAGDTATFLQTLLCASVVLPVGDPAAAHIRVGDPAFRWSSDIVDGNIGITVYTTVERMAERVGEDTPHTVVPFGWLIQHWPGQDYALYVNPGTEVGANMSGPEVEPLLKWAEAKDLLTFASEMERRQAAAARLAPGQRVQPILWQKTIPHHQVPFYLERGYDRVGGFVHPAEAVDHLRTPAQLYLALGLIRSSEDFSPTDDSVHVLRWIGYRTDLYPQALGGNGFAPSESPEDRIPEHKVDSVRLPHAAKILRIDSRGEVAEIALYDADTREWTPVDGAFGSPPAIEAPSTPALPAAPAAETPPPAGPMGESYGYSAAAQEAAPGYDNAPGYDSALGEAWGDASGHYDLVRPAPEDRAAHVLDHRDREWKDA